MPEVGAVQMSLRFSPTQFLETFSNTSLPAFARTLLPQRAPLKPSESCVVALECPRTAALCFDRVWSIPIDEIDCPEDISFNGTSDAETVAALWIHYWKNVGSQFKDFRDIDVKALANALVKGDTKAIMERDELMALYSTALLLGTLTGGFEPVKNPLHKMTRTLCTDLQKKIPQVVSLYASEVARDAEYIAGDRTVIITALRQLQVVDEEELSWEQVMEFRLDRSSRTDYQRLVHWLDDEMIGRSTEYIIDEIGVRLERYKQALKKHGLKSRIGLLTSILDPKALASAGAAAGGAMLAEQVLTAVLAAGGVLLGKVLIGVGQSKLDLHDVHAEHAEITFVAQVNKRFKKD
jgi:hypothetical protein